MLRKDAIYDQLLSEREFLNNEGWYTALEEDKDLMKAIAKFRYKDRDKALVFYLLDVTKVDQLRAVYSSSSSNGSSANAYVSLDVNQRFLRVAQRV